ncbi:inositol monophosphatase [Thalassovita sp.]|uniref:inositol monophosphatase family protein n=1 Tax=Thalassovita sp. TaxID=1979401 RepID=UPI0029DE6F81|nr:inositol monophosphatase [Thalassovita sp.]
MSETLPLPLTPLTQAQQTSLVNIVRRAAKTEILPRFRNLSAHQISTKSGPQDLVTEADEAAEAMIARGILRLFPNAVVIGEEAASRDPSLRDTAAKAELAFIIDPVDGTWNFAHGVPLFGVILAATRFGKPIFGLLYDPIVDDWVIADNETRTRLSGAGRIDLRVNVSKGGDLADLSGVMHYYLMPKDVQAKLAPVLPNFYRMGSIRCSCHEYRLMAQGAVDFCLSGILNPWDHAAGVLLCQQAGGVARMLDGREYDISIRQGYILCAPDPATWDRLQAALSPLIG